MLLGRLLIAFALVGNLFAEAVYKRTYTNGGTTVRKGTPGNPGKIFGSQSIMGLGKFASRNSGGIQITFKEFADATPPAKYPHDASACWSYLNLIRNKSPSVAKLKNNAQWGDFISYLKSRNALKSGWSWP